VTAWTRNGGQRRRAERLEPVRVARDLAEEEVLDAADEPERSSSQSRGYVIAAVAVCRLLGFRVVAID
jgi:hypothetical protein